ncbi:MAG: hypothetical protein RBT71_00410 [Flavobacteriales bacterium]|jgi:hypothetical protein|nr:hypothetical protein [Flavobacteriales bacterium]
MLLVHLDDPSPRALYVVRHVLEGMLGLSVRFAAGEEEFRSAAGPRLAYGRRVFIGALHVPGSDGLALHRTPGTVATDADGTPAIFLTAGGHDLFASIFFLLSLADEIACTDRDAHGRVRPDALFVVRHGLAERPWADHWALQLGERLAAQWPGLRVQRRYRHVVTVDMDNVLRHAGRPLHRALGATAKDLLKGDLRAVRQRWKDRLTGRDPYLAVPDRVAEHRSLVDDAILFMLLRGEGAHDHAVPPQRWPAHVRARYARLAPGVRLGLHPSYDAVMDRDRWAQEAAWIRALPGVDAIASRHHFLRWDPPAGLRTVQELGFTEEHSLGFADRPGFRAATCTPFPWYDLERDTATGLMLHPFAVMDSALVEKRHLAPDDVVRTMSTFSDHVRAVQGNFTSVWHDRYLSGHREFAPWPTVFQRVLQHARP